MDPEWARRVRVALVAQDEAALADLYAAAERELGGEAASHAWMEVVSAYDADAETG